MKAIIGWIMLLQQGWRLKRTNMRAIGLPNRWHWQDPKTGNRWLESAAIVICKRRIQLKKTGGNLKP